MIDVLTEGVKAVCLAKIQEAKLGEAQDIANVVALLASDEAQYITELHQKPKMQQHLQYPELRPI